MYIKITNANNANANVNAKLVNLIIFQVLSFC